MTWKDAFLRQARSDFQTFRDLQKGNASLCHQAHYVQMATEKLAKAYLCPPGGEPPRPTHDALVKFLRVCIERPEIRRRLGFGDVSVCRAHIRGLLPLAGQIQELAPEGGALDKPNPEYPWRDAGSWQVCSPLDYAFPQFTNARDPQINKLLNLVRRLLETDSQEGWA